jgi:hypothetical protein
MIRLFSRFIKTKNTLVSSKKSDKVGRSTLTASLSLEEKKVLENHDTETIILPEGEMLKNTEPTEENYEKEERLRRIDRYSAMRVNTESIERIQNKLRDITKEIFDLGSDENSILQQIREDTTLTTDEKEASIREIKTKAKARREQLLYSKIEWENSLIDEKAVRENFQKNKLSPPSEVNSSSSRKSLK